MKKLMRRTFAILCAAMMLTGCGAKDGKEESTEDPFTKLPDYTWDGVNVEDYVKIGQYEGVEYEPASSEVTEKDVDEVVKQLQEGSATSKKITEGKVKDKDTVNIDYVGRMDGKEFEGGSAKNQTITIGVSSMIPGFVEGLIGEEIGSTIVLDLKFPTDYWKKELQGKPVEFTITINYVAGENVLPEVNDEWVKTLTGGKYKTVEDLRKDLRKTLEEEAKAKAEADNQMAVWDQVFKNATVNGYPEGALDYYYAQQVRQAEEIAASYGMTYEQFVKLLDKTMAEMEKDLKEAAEEYAANLMVARVILKEQNKEITEAQYKKFVEELAKAYDYDDLDELVKDYGGKLAILDDLVVEQAVTHVMGKAVAKNK